MLKLAAYDILFARGGKIMGKENEAGSETGQGLPSNLVEYAISTPGQREAVTREALRLGREMFSLVKERKTKWNVGEIVNDYLFLKLRDGPVYLVLGPDAIGVAKEPTVGSIIKGPEIPASHFLAMMVIDELQHDVKYPMGMTEEKKEQQRIAFMEQKRTARNKIKALGQKMVSLLNEGKIELGDACKVDEGTILVFNEGGEPVFVRGTNLEVCRVGKPEATYKRGVLENYLAQTDDMMSDIIKKAKRRQSDL